MPAIARWFALGWSALMAGGLLWLPVYGLDGSIRNTDGDAQVSGAGIRGDLVAFAGDAALFFLAFPIVLTALPLVAPRAWRRRLTLIGAVLMTLYALLGIATLGLLHVPTAIALWVAVGGAERHRPPRPA